MSRLRRFTLFAAAVFAAGTAGAVAGTATAHAATTFTVLFDDTSDETAGNADWIISTSMPDPTAQDPNPSSETDWTGALSSWGVALQQAGGYSLSTLPPSSSITSSALSGVDVLVLPEPNVLFTSAERSAILSFVQNGGGLFMISDHSGSDRDNDGADSVEVLNGLMSGDPFGMHIDSGDISSENPDVLGSSDDVLDGPFGTVTGTIIRDGTTVTLDGSASKGEVYRSGYTAGGTTGVAFATSTYGSGRVAYWGDSSPVDDGTGQSGNDLYDGWNDPAGTDGTLALDATAWLAGSSSGGTTGSPLSNGGFESGTSPWSLSGASIVTTRAHGGSHSLRLGGTNSTTDSATQNVLVPSSGTLKFWTYVSTQETGTTAYDKLTVKVGSATVATLSNASTTGSWVSTSASLSAYAGQTVNLSISATNGTKLPTSFWVDDVSIG